MRVWRGVITLSVQDLVCDGCRWVAVEGALLVLWAVCGMFAGCRWVCVVGLGCTGGRWWVDGGGDRLVLLAVRGRWCGRVVWVGIVQLTFCYV